MNNDVSIYYVTNTLILPNEIMRMPHLPEAV